MAGCHNEERMQDTREASSAVHIGRASSKRAVSGRYIPGLDGWRAVAILWVVVSHNQLLHLGRVNDIWLKNSGQRAVQLFFALSGYLICTRLLQEEKKAGSISLRSFYLRRVFRIQPAAMLYLAAIAVIMLAGGLPRWWPGLVGAALMVRNYWPAHLSPGYWYSLHFWSLAVEEHFYLFLPGFLLLVRRSRLLIVSLLVVIAEGWFVYVLHHERLQRVGSDLLQRTDMSIGCIMLGSVFALALERERLMALARRWLKPSIALIYAATVMLVLNLHHSSFYHALLITLYPPLIVSTALHPHSSVTRFLEWPPMRFLGRISYSLYLWQELFFHAGTTPAPGSLHAHVVLCWIGAFTFAIASYYLVETPLIRFGHRLSSRKDGAEHVLEVPAVVKQFHA